jgi:HAD superfamily hydrolase (TIGR01509 family)
MIRALIFDCFGVLYRDNISMLYDTVRPEQYQDMQDIIHATDYGLLTREEYYTQIAALAGKTPDEIRQIESKQHSRDDEMIAYAQTLKSKYKVALLSNIDPDTMQRLFPEPQRSELFDAFIISGEVGITKPSPEIFAIAARKLGVLPEECLMIDDLLKNVEGARMAGMQAVLFTTRRQLEQDLPSLLAEQHA